jgi:hypothetical protein
MTNIILAILLVLSQALGIGGDVDSKIEQAMKAELGQKIEDVKVDSHINNGALMTKGKIAAIDFDLKGLWMKPVRVEGAQFQVKDIRVDSSKILTGKAEKCIRSIGDITFRFDFLPKDLTRALKLDSPNIKDPKVNIEGGMVVIEGKYPVGPIAVPFIVKGFLTYEGGSRIYYRIQNAKLVGIGLPGGIKQSIEDELNPIFDLDKFEENKKDDFDACEELIGRRLELVIRQVIASGNRIIITGSI